MKKICFIVNPISGTTGKKNIVGLIPKYFNEPDFMAEIKYTERPGHATELAAVAAGEGYDIVVAVGGDGTVNEVARSLVHTPAALGIIPCGSGNGLARHLAIPTNVVKAMKILQEATIQTLDYGRLNEHFFFCTCGVGFDAFVSDKFARSGKRGFLSYMENTLVEGVRYQPEEYELEVDGERQQFKAFLIACGNASQYGNNAYITPQASMADGLIDVTVMEPFGLVSAPHILLQMFSKSLNENDHIHSFRCKHLKILREKAGVVHYDGDPVMMDGDLDISIVEKGINMVVNANGKVNVSPVLRTFTEIYSGISSGVHQIGRGMDSTGKRIKKINDDLLNRLKS